MASGWSLVAASALAGVIAVWSAVLAARARGRTRQVHARLGAITGADALQHTAHGSVVTVSGVLEGERPIVSYHPYGASLMDEAHVYARTAAVEAPVVRVGRQRVVLTGPVQVVLGDEETARKCDAKDAARELDAPEAATIPDATSGQFRIVRPGTKVLVRGALGSGPARKSEVEGGAEAGYRQSAAGLELRPPVDPSWPDRPISLVSATPRAQFFHRTVAIVAAIVMATGGSAALVILRGHAASVGSRPSCGLAIDAALSSNDVERAAAKLLACSDPLARAKVAWAQADFPAAARAFGAARAAYPDLVPTVSEIEAHALAREERRARELVTTMANALYPGPSTPEKARLECVAGAFGQRTGDRTALEGLMKNFGGRAPLCAVVGRDLGYDVLVSDNQLTGILLPGEREYFARLDDERFHYHTQPAEMNYDAAALYPDGWMSVHRPYAVDVTVLAGAKTGANKYEGYAEHHAMRAQAIELLDLASYDVELAIFLAYMGRSLADVNPHLERVRASDAFEREHRVLIDMGFLFGEGSSQEEIDARDAELRTHGDHRQALHAGAGAAAMLAGDPAPEPWLADGQPFMSGVIRHHMALMRDPRGTSINIQGAYPFAWPHSDLFDKAGVSTRALADGLAETRAINPTIVRELVARSGAGARGDASLADWVEHRFPAPCWDCGLTALAVNVGARLANARSVGDERFARSLEIVADRIIEATLKRDVAPELFVLELDPARR